MPYGKISLGFPAHSSGIHTKKSGTHSFNNFIWIFHSCFTRIEAVTSLPEVRSLNLCKVKVEQNYNSCILVRKAERVNENYEVCHPISREKALRPHSFWSFWIQAVASHKHNSSGPESLHCLQCDLTSRVFVVNLGLRVVFIIFFNDCVTKPSPSSSAQYIYFVLGYICFSTLTIPIRGLLTFSLCASWQYMAILRDFQREGGGRGCGVSLQRFLADNAFQYGKMIMEKELGQRGQNHSILVK